MTRVAIYARFSSEKQNARSIADQLALCLQHAERQGWTLAATFSDAAISGAAMANRPGLLGALEAADRGEFDVLLCEDEDRIARNLEHLAHVANRLRAAGAYLSTLGTPRVETMHVAFKGLIAEDYLRSLSAKTKRGVRANAERGLATGSRLYGYRTQPGGAQDIVEAEAEVIRSIFRAYADGRTARDIAASLNLARVPSPRGGQWNASTINGSPTRASGILRTELYTGVKVFNRMEVVKDPFTGRRTPKIKPAEEWRRTPVPHLRIVDQEVWDAVQAIKAAQAPYAFYVLKRQPGLFSGLLKCGLCGGSYSSTTNRRLGCSAHRERGASACANARSINREELEERVLVGLQRRLLAPDLVAAYVRAYHAAWTERRRAETDRREPIERRLAEIRRVETRTIAAIERGVATRAMEQRLVDNEAEAIRLEVELAAMGDPEPPVELHPRVAEGYAELVSQLHARLADAAAGDAAADRRAVDAVRGLVDRIVITPLLARRGSPYEVELHGRLTDLLQPGVVAQERRVPLCGGKVVAGGGLEPPT